MPQVFDITEDDISYAESILLPEGQKFDTQRRSFINNYDTIDLQAVPGSGKTTALLAKLLILEKKLPFVDGSGVLVISHTNAAVDEIKDKIQKYCPKLFSYPNYVGTIQSFIDEYLAIPYYLSCYKKKIVRIDSEIYSEVVDRLFKRNIQGFAQQEQKNARYYLFGSNSLHLYRIQIRNGEDVLVSNMNGNELQVVKPRRGSRYVDFTVEEKLRIKEWLFEFKNSIMQKSGVLHYDDAYYLAEKYLHNIPSIKQLLQKRFCFIFVDEMQDMDKHQYEILERIFFDEGHSLSAYQRIGDKNQSIFNGDAKLEIYWTDRHVVLPLNGSQRLTPAIANVVKNFALYRSDNFNIIGLRNGEIKPCIIKYNDQTIGNVIQKFLNRIVELKECPEHVEFRKKLRELDDKGNKKNQIKVIAWNAEWKTEEEKNDPSKVRLSDYYSAYCKEGHRTYVDYNSLKSYLQYYDKNSRTLGAVRKNILSALSKILRLEEIYDVDGRCYTAIKMINTIKEYSDVNKSEALEKFKLNLFNWSMDIVRGRKNEVCTAIMNYIPEFLQVFVIDKRISGCQSFITCNNLDAEIVETVSVSNNKIQYDEIEAEITTVHAVKGQTHLATLYLESYYHADGRGNAAKSYESQRLAGQFLGDAIDISSTGERAKQSCKMAYVGLSRATDFLCVALHVDRCNQYLSGLDIQKWEVINA